MEANAYKQQKERFQKIFEYTILGNTIDEDGGDKQQQPQDAPPMPPQDGGQPMGQDGQMPPQDGGQPTGPDMGGGQPMGPDMGGGQPMGPDMGGDPQGGQNIPQGLNPQPDITQGDFEGDGGMPMGPDMGDGQPAPEDDVVDITDLTDKQEETQEEIEGFNEKFVAVLDKIKQFTDMIKSNDEKIDQLKAEFEKRNPTQLEKLSMHTAKGEPFNVDPTTYWDEKEATSNYRTEDDNNGKGQGQYTITANDINSGNDWRTIASSLNSDDDDDIILNQSLSKLLSI